MPALPSSFLFPLSTFSFPSSFYCPRAEAAKRKQVEGGGRAGDRATFLFFFLFFCVLPPPSVRRRIGPRNGRNRNAEGKGPVMQLSPPLSFFLRTPPPPPTADPGARQRMKVNDILSRKGTGPSPPRVPFFSSPLRFVFFSSLFCFLDSGQNGISDREAAEARTGAVLPLLFLFPLF